MHNCKSPNASRNQRSKGIKGKHILQICVLLGVCFWLVYQAEHSHENKTKVEDNESNILLETQNDGNLPKLGRKDISRVRESVTKNEVVGEDKRHEEERSNEEEESSRGGGDDEIDKHEDEKIDIDNENHEELIVDEEKGREEGDDQNDDGNKQEESEDQDEEKEAQNSHGEEKEVVLEDDMESRNTHEEDKDEDHEMEGEDTHEAREELYKADDVSSEVAQSNLDSGKKQLDVGSKKTTSKGSLSLLDEMKLRHPIHHLPSSLTKE